MYCASNTYSVVLFEKSFVEDRIKQQFLFILKFSYSGYVLSERWWQFEYKANRMYKVPFTYMHYVWGSSYDIGKFKNMPLLQDKTNNEVMVIFIIQ
jgi:hypothetical protein